LIIGDLLLSDRIRKTAARLSSHILYNYIYKHTLCYKIKSLTLLKQMKFTKQTRARTRRRRQDITTWRTWPPSMRRWLHVIL